ncbi:hypothetical protein RHGRI_024126 [Rhododendron griersonianum]|uniref:HNH endonuclease n=1 Tax=Rhododendron griersonianum TaxID=479676 RepID=A0AAV6JBP1_9ERIC|nr:hypothetical protein RHGRI_024126 [Rhododendron griersonianum]
MGPNRPRKRRNHSSPTRTRPLASSGFDPTPSASRPSTLSPTGVSVLDRHLVTEEVSIDFFEKLRISPDSDNNPRSFPYNVKQQCWEKAEKVRGRDPDRWRRDPLGNTVFRKLVGCPGCLCHDYDHIVPGERAHWKTAKFYRQLLIDQRGTALRSLEQILFRKVLIVGFQVVTWIFLNCRLMAMCDEDKILEDAGFSDKVQGPR